MGNLPEQRQNSVLIEEVSLPTVDLNRNLAFDSTTDDPGRFPLGDIQEFLSTAQAVGYTEDSLLRFRRNVHGTVTALTFSERSEKNGSDGPVSVRQKVYTEREMHAQANRFMIAIMLLTIALMLSIGFGLSAI